MEIRFTKGFLKELKRCPLEIQKDISVFIKDIIESDNLMSINNVKKLTGYKNYYRYRIRQWRVGIELEEGSIKLSILITVAPRGDIYKKFPPK